MLWNFKIQDILIKFCNVIKAHINIKNAGNEILRRLSFKYE